VLVVAVAVAHTVDKVLLVLVAVVLVVLHQTATAQQAHPTLVAVVAVAHDHQELVLTVEAV
jgi:hypothetical protein